MLRNKSHERSTTCTPKTRTRCGKWKDIACSWFRTLPSLLRLITLTNAVDRFTANSSKPQCLISEMESWLSTSYTLAKNHDRQSVLEKEVRGLTFPSMGGNIKTRWSVHRMDCQSAMKRNEALTRATMWMVFDNNMPWEKTGHLRPHVTGLHVYETSRVGTSL